MKVRLLAAAAAVLTLAACGSSGTPATAPSTPPASTPQVTVLKLKAPTPAATSARCIAPSAQTLRRATHAFDGTVTAIAGNQITLSVTRWYAGGGGTQVQVTGAPPELQTLVGAVDFTQGGRFLVASSAEDTVMVCGFSGAWSPRLETMYRVAFPNL